MGLDRLLGDHQLSGDLQVRQPARDECEHLRLALGEIGDPLLEPGPARPVRHPGELLDQQFGQVRREQRLPAGHHPDRVGEFGRRGVLEQEPGGPGAQCLEDVLVQVERGQHQDLRIRGAAGARLGDAARRLDAAQPRHPHVHQHDVGRQLGGALHRLQPVDRLTGHGDVRLRVQQHGEALADHLLVVGQQYADRGRGHDGSSAVSAVRMVPAFPVVPAVLVISVGRALPVLGAAPAGEGRGSAATTRQPPSGVARPAACRPASRPVRAFPATRDPHRALPERLRPVGSCPAPARRRPPARSPPCGGSRSPPPPRPPARAAAHC